MRACTCDGVRRGAQGPATGGVSYHSPGRCGFWLFVFPELLRSAELRARDLRAAELRRVPVRLVRRALSGAGRSRCGRARGGGGEGMMAHGVLLPCLDGHASNG